MDSAEGDTTVRFRAPGSILITRDYFSLGRDNFQPPLNRDPWKRQPRQRPSSQESPPVRENLRPLIPHSYSTPLVEKWSESAPNRSEPPSLEALPWRRKTSVAA